MTMEKTSFENMEYETEFMRHLNDDSRRYARRSQRLYLSILILQAVVNSWNLILSIHKHDVVIFLSVYVFLWLVSVLLVILLANHMRKNPS